MLSDQLARQEQIAVRLEQSKRLLRGANDPAVARPEFSRGAHPRWIKRKLLDMVDRGRSVHEASIACGVSYATAKTWARNEQSRKVRAKRGE